LAASDTARAATSNDERDSTAPKQQVDGSNAVDTPVGTVEDTPDGMTRKSKDASAQTSVAASNASRTEERDAQNEANSERREEAAAMANRGQASEIIAAQTAQQAAASNGDSTSESNRSALKPVSANGDVVQTTLGRTPRGADAAQRAAPGQASELPRVDATRFVGRVAKAVQVAQERGGALQLRLSPPELGSLRLELTVQNGVMTASLETETSAARQILLDHLPALRDRLAEQNIRVERFDVDVRQQQHGGGGDPSASQQQEHQQQPQHSNSRQSVARGDRSEPTESDAPTIRTHTTSGGINVFA
jgi:flagellar hook-length control protein FliK